MTIDFVAEMSCAAEGFRAISSVVYIVRH
jgi:hypothetical protein